MPVALWPRQDAATVADVWSACRYCVDLLRTRPRLRRRFPRALSEGADGAFAAWLRRDRLWSRLDEPARGAIRLVFDHDPAAPVRHVFTVREDVRRAFPLGLTPADSREFVSWLFRHGIAEHRLRPEMIAWFALLIAENPTIELLRTFRFMPEWQQAVPDGPTIFGRRALAEWIGTRYGLSALWLNPAAWPFDMEPAEQIRLAYAGRSAWRDAHPRAFRSTKRAEELLRWLLTTAGLDSECIGWLTALDLEATAGALAAGGANVLGHFCYPSGLRSSTELVVESLGRAGVPSSLRDVPVDPYGDEPRHAVFAGLESYEATILHVEPEPLFGTAYARAGLSERRPRTHRIGYWYWELDTIPEPWRPAGRYVDELWTASGFTAAALRRAFDVPVHILPPGLELPPVPTPPRSNLGWSRSEFVFLFVFHMTSTMERKNPLGLIRAFRRAFEDDPSVRLVLKTSFGSRHPELDGGTARRRRGRACSGDRRGDDQRGDPGVDGGLRLLCVAAPKRGLRPYHGGGDAARKADDRDRLLGQRRLHACRQQPAR